MVWLQTGMGQMGVVKLVEVEGWVADSECGCSSMLDVVWLG